MINKYLEERAEQLLNEHNYLSEPLPIDILGLCNKLKVIVEKLILDDNVSGFFALENGVAHIGYNDSHGKERKRFTIAHELAHFILHSKDRPLFIDKMYRNSNSSTGEDYREVEANAFAAALLMPKKLIEKELGNNIQNITRAKQKSLASKFQVSEQAMNIRLINLDIINYNS